MGGPKNDRPLFSHWNPSCSKCGRRMYWETSFLNPEPDALWWSRYDHAYVAPAIAGWHCHCGRWIYPQMDVVRGLWEYYWDLDDD